MANIPKELKIKIKVDIEDVNDLKKILQECNKDAKELGLNKRQVKALMKTISKENSSYRKTIRDMQR